MCQRGDEVDRQGRTIASSLPGQLFLFKEKRRAASHGMTKQLRPLMLHLFGNYAPISIACHACKCSRKQVYTKFLRNKTITKYGST